MIFVLSMFLLILIIGSIIIFKITNISAEPNTANCKEVYDNHNNATDASRFNIVFIGVGFETTNDLKQSAQRLLSLNNDTFYDVRVNNSGLMQIPIFKQYNESFNFWYVDRQKNFSDTSCLTISSELYQWEWIYDCQDMLPNRVIPIFNYPHPYPTAYCPAGSMGRRYTNIYDCVDARSDCNNVFIPDLQNGNVHELLHTIPCLFDEYGTSGTITNPKPFTGELIHNQLLQFYVNETPNGYNECITNAPWEDHIGNGCGTDGVIDCFDQSISGCNVSAPIDFSFWGDTREDCCLPGKNCTMEIACFRGGLSADVEIWRAASGTIMRNNYQGKRNGTSLIDEWDQNITERVIKKGPAIGKVWQRLNGWIPNYQMDCDATTPLFVGDDRFLVKSSGQIKAFLDENGNIKLNQICVESSTCNPPSNSFIVENSSGNSVAYVAPNGTLCAKNGCSQKTNCSMPGVDSFIIKNASGTIVSYINSTGSLCFMGNLTENVQDF